MIDSWETVHLNIKRYNHKHCYVFYSCHLSCREILTVIYCLDKQIMGITVINRSIHYITGREDFAYSSFKISFFLFCNKF